MASSNESDQEEARDSGRPGQEFLFLQIKTSLREVGMGLLHPF